MEQVFLQNTDFKSAMNINSTTPDKMKTKQSQNADTSLRPSDARQTDLSSHSAMILDNESF